MDRRIVVVNDQDEIIGGKVRSALATSDIYRVTALWTTNSTGDVLLAQRKHTKRHDPLKWGPAVAGTVNEGETYESNIAKEAEEELGLKDLSFTKGPKQRVQGEYLHFCQWFTVTIDKPIEDFTIQEDEVEQIKWFSQEELERWLREHPEEFVTAMRNGMELLNDWLSGK